MRVLAIAAALFATHSFAAGFLLPEQNARSSGMAGVGAASSEGAAGIYYNPGAVAFEDGMAAEVSLLGLLPMLNGQTAGVTYAAERAFNLAPTVFVEAPLAQRFYLGLGGFSGFGARVAWPDDFPGRFEGSASSLITYTINPTFALRVNDDIGIGAGVDVTRAAVRLDRKLDFASAEGTLSLGGGTWGVGGNAGVELRMMSKRLRVGANYRSATTLNFDGTASFDVPPELESELRDQDVRTTFVLPHTVSLGAGFLAQPKLLLTAEATYTTWSTLQSIDIDFEDDARDQSLPRNWSNSVAVKAAAEYRLSPSLSLRGGAGFDQTPSPDNTTQPSLPDASRVLLSAGAGYRVGNFGVDFGYLLALLMPRTTTPDAFPASYSGMAHVFALSASFRQ